MLKYREDLNLVFHALADPTRRAIVDHLMLGPASVTELARPLDMSLAAVVQHLQVLQASALVGSEKRGRVRTCFVNEAALTMAQDWISARKKIWEDRLDRLGAVMDANEVEPKQKGGQ